MTIYKISWLFLLLIHIVFIIYIFYYAKNNLNKQKVVFLVIATGLWILGHGMLKEANTVKDISFWARMIFLGSTSIIFCIYWISLNFVEKKNKYLNISISILYLILVLILIFTNLFLSNFNPQGRNLVEKAPMGPMFFLILLVYSFVTISCIRNFIYAFKHSGALVRTQILYVAFSSLATFLFALINAGFLPALGINTFVWLAPYGAIIYLSGITYAIFKYRLLELQIFVQKTLVNLIIILSIIIAYISLNFMLKLVLKKNIPVEYTGLCVILTSFITLLYFAYHSKIEVLSTRLFAKQKQDYYSKLEQQLRKMSSCIDQKSIFALVEKFILQDIQVENLAIYLSDIREEQYSCTARAGKNTNLYPKSVKADNVLTKYLLLNPQPLDVDEFRHKYGHLYQKNKILDKTKADIQNILDQVLSAKLVISLIIKGKLVGFIVIGQKRSGYPYSSRDMYILETFGIQIATTIENVQLYDQVLNNERLSIIGTMSAGIAHEIRNPLAAIKTFIQLLPEKYSRPEFRSRFEEIVPTEIERISSITQELLTFSKPSSPSLEETYIQPIIDRILTLLSNQIRKRKIKIEKEIDELPVLQVDSQQMSQVFLNLLLNAIQASNMGGKIKIVGKVKTSINKNKEKNLFLLISIMDNGVGIKKTDINNIFHPFYSTKSEGSGLGLATCKRIVEAHQGGIYVESEEGKGAKFNILLPQHPIEADKVI